MALEFKCKHCNELMFLKFLKIGEIAKCKMCGKKNTIPKDAQMIHESDIPEKYIGYDDLNKKSNKSKVETSVNTEKYPALKFVSGLLKFISFMLAFISFIIFFMAFEGVSSYRVNEVFMVAIIPFIYSIIAAICMYAYGELITLFIDVEKNTRKFK